MDRDWWAGFGRRGAAVVTQTGNDEGFCQSSLGWDM